MPLPLLLLLVYVCWSFWICTLMCTFAGKAAPAVVIVVDALAIVAIVSVSVCFVVQISWMRRTLLSFGWLDINSASILN